MGIFSFLSKKEEPLALSKEELEEETATTPVVTKLLLTPNEPEIEPVVEETPTVIVEQPQPVAAPTTPDGRKRYTVESSFCPACRKDVEGHKCRLCGATKTINAVSGAVIWMRNGRVIAAHKDSKSAWVAMAVKHRIPQDQWPAEFLDVKN